MIVLDASAPVALLLGTADGDAVVRRIADPELSLHVPHLVDLEVVQALRRYVREREIDVSDARLMLRELRALDLQRHAHEPLLDRVWALRSNLTAYDAVYVALDVDILDPAEAAMFMPEPDGPSVDAIATTLHDVASGAPLAGIGITGMLPDERNVEVVSRLLRAAAQALPRRPQSARSSPRVRPRRKPAA